MARLEDILDEISSALRAGDYARLDTLSAMLETVLLPQDVTILHRAARKLRRNEAMLAAAASGFRAARRRLDDLGNASTLTTYDGQGRKQNHLATIRSAHRL